MVNVQYSIIVIYNFSNKLVVYGNVFDFKVQKLIGALN